MIGAKRRLARLQPAANSQTGLVGILENYLGPGGEASLENGDKVTVEWIREPQ